jgi:hypothetical protein
LHDQGVSESYLEISAALLIVYLQGESGIAGQLRIKLPAEALKYSTHQGRTGGKAKAQLSRGLRLRCMTFHAEIKALDHLICRTANFLHSRIDT